MPEVAPTPAPEPTPAPAATIVAPSPTPEIAPAPALNEPPAPTPDWRDEFAGEDAAFRKRLERFPDKAAWAKSYRALEAKMSSGELKKVLPEGATPEELATWRKENGLPEKPEGYIEKLALPNGLVLGEADKPIVAEFAAAALEGNIDDKQFSGMVAKYYAILDAQKVAREDADAKFHDDSQNALREVWQGADFRKNVAAVNNLIAGWPAELANRVLAGRTPEGRLLGDDPAFIQQLAGLARELNPAATLVPAGTSDHAKGVEDRIGEIEKFMKTDRAAYFKDQKMQDEYLQLVDARDKMKSRAA